MKGNRGGLQYIIVAVRQRHVGLSVYARLVRETIRTRKREHWVKTPTIPTCMYSSSIRSPHTTFDSYKEVPCVCSIVPDRGTALMCMFLQRFARITLRLAKAWALPRLLTGAVRAETGEEDGETRSINKGAVCSA